MSKKTDGDGAFERVGETMGGLAGKAAGKGMDMAMDVGTAFLGAAADLLGGWWSGPEAKKAAGSFGEREDRACRSHFEESAATGGSGYDRARPLYQFGHMAGQNPDYQGRSFDQVEAELERAWAQAGRERFGDWPQVRSYVGFGYGESAGSGAHRR